MFTPWQTELTLFESVPPIMLAAALFGLGVMCLLFGWHVYRVSLVTLAVLIGGAMGAGIAFLAHIPMVILALPVGILVGLVAARLEKVGAFLIGGLCSALWILSSPTFSGPRVGLYVAAGLAFLITGILAILLWRPMIIVSLAATGSWFLASAVLLSADTFSPGALRQIVSQHPHWVIVLMALVTLIGVWFQYRSGGGAAAEGAMPNAE